MVHETIDHLKGHIKALKDPEKNWDHHRKLAFRIIDNHLSDVVVGSNQERLKLNMIITLVAKFLRHLRYCKDKINAKKYDNAIDECVILDRIEKRIVEAAHDLTSQTHTLVKKSK